MVLLFLWYRRWRSKTVKKIGDPRLVKSLYPGYSFLKTAIRFVLFLFAFALGCIAIANPRKPDEVQDDARKGIDVVLALDVSNSMLATDLAPSRLQRAQAMLLKLIDQLPNDRIALVLFAGNAYLQMPLTTDHGAAKIFITTASPASITAQGTSVANALEKSSLAFQADVDRFKTIIVVSDGESHDENAIEMATELAGKGVMINTVGIGSATGSTILDTASNSEKKDASGNVIISRLNEQLLQQMASLSRGVYINLQATDRTVEQMVQHLSQIERKALGDTTVFTYQTFYVWLALPMLLLLVAEMFFPDRKKIKE